MRQLVRIAAVGSGFALLCASPPPALGQLTTAGIRGKVLDEAGNGIPGVRLDMEFEGESRTKITKSQETDKRGGFVRMGIPDGKWKVTFSKPGYQTYIMEISLSLGGFSEAGDVVLKAAPATPPAAAAGSPAGAPGGAQAPEADTSLAAYRTAIDAAKAGRYDEAEAALKELLVAHPDAAGVHFNLGYVYRMKKDWKAAEAEYLRVAELEPDRIDAVVALAGVREADGRLEEAARGLESAAPAFPTDARFQYALGITSVNAGRSAEAAEAFRKALELDPANAEATYQLATVLVGQNKKTEAVTLLEKYVGMTGQDPANLQTAKALLGALKK